MKIIEISSIEKLIEYKEKFKNLELHVSFFQNYEFILNYLSFYKEKFSINFIQNKDQIIMIPLSMFKYKKLRFYGFIGSPDISEENDLVSNLKDFNEFAYMMDFFFNNNKKKFFFCNLKKGFFKEYLSKNKDFYETNKVNANIVDVSKSEFYLNEHSKKKNHLYELRKFEKDYNIKEEDFEISDLNKQETEKYEILNFIKSNKNINNSKFEKTLNFLISLVKLELTKVSLLKAKNLILSAIIYSVYENKLYYLIPSYNKLFKKFSFGKIHLNKLIKMHHLKGINRLFLGPGNEEYKKKFILSDEKIYFFSNSLILRYLLKLKFFIKGNKFE